jgi:uncharacterized membrane protein
MLILGVGILAVCYWKHWPLMNLGSFIGTYLLFFASMRAYQVDEFWNVLPFAAAFFVLFSTMTFLYTAVRKKHSSVLDVLAVLINAGIFYAVSYRLIDEAYGRKWIAGVTLPLVAFFAGHVFVFIKRKLVDRELVITFQALAAVFLFVTFPLLVTDAFLTVSWSAMALTLLWIGRRTGSQVMHTLSSLVYIVVAYRIGVIDLPREFPPGAVTQTVMEFLQSAGMRLVVFGVPVASLLCARRLLATPVSDPRAIPQTNDLTLSMEDQGLSALFGFMALGMGFAFLNFELTRSVGYFAPSFKQPSLTWLWLAVCVVLLKEAVTRGSQGVLVLASLGLIAVFAKLLAVDLRDWHLSPRFLYDGTYAATDGLLRLIDLGAVVLVLGYARIALVKSNDLQSAGSIFGFAAIASLFAYLSLETNTLLHNFLPQMQKGGISILWSLFALGLLIRGIGWRERAVRYLGLMLFCVVSFKVFFVDLAQLDALYRIIAFIILGVLVLCGSLLYLKHREAFEDSPAAAPEPVPES